MFFLGLDWVLCSENLWACMLSCFSHVQHFETPWTVCCQALLSMGFSRQEIWSGLPYPPPGDLPNPGIKPASFMSPSLADRFFITSSTWVWASVSASDSYAEPHGDNTGKWDLWELIRSWGRPLRNGIRAWIKEAWQRSLALPHFQDAVWSWQSTAWNRSFTRAWLCKHPDLGLHVSRITRNKCPLVIGHSVVFCYSLKRISSFLY